MPKIALLTDQRYTAPSAKPEDWYLANILKDDALLQAALTALGISSERIDWAAKDIDWRSYDCALFRTTWDYFDRFEEFTHWLTKIEQQTKLINSSQIIRWNQDKHYLAELEQQGVAIVPSLFIEKGSMQPLAELLKQSGWKEAVIKPCIAGGARQTYRINALNAHETDTLISQLRKIESFILQPFMPEIIKTGEDSLMLFGGRFSHSIRKVAKPGDFRVQDDHGGKVHAYTATADQIAFAENALAAISKDGRFPEKSICYARVDIVKDGDSWRIMELELIEPELWLRFHEPSAVMFADAIQKLL